LHKVDLSSAQYTFAVCTRGGSPSEAFDHINDMLSAQGKRLDAQLNVTMPWNHPLGKEDLTATADSERIQRLESEMQRKLDDFSERILAREAYVVEERDADYGIPGWIEALTSLIPRSLNYGSHRYMYQRLVRFYSDDQCVGCGVCEQVCPSSRIELASRKPVWKEPVKCFGCFACINYCPQQAIQIASRFPFFRSYTEVNGRYHHSAVTYRDIAAQR
jgi:ferredoxin